MIVTAASHYRYHDGAHAGSHSYLWPSLKRVALSVKEAGGRRAIDIGCGNGSMTGRLASLGFDTVGIDPSESGIAIAQQQVPGCKFEVGSAYDDIRGKHGLFDFVVSLEVIEHLYDPRFFARTLIDVLEPGGMIVLSTPYHGYLKNCALAISGRLDQHFTALWDGGHIKFWSRRTLGRLLQEVGFSDIRFERVGRVPPLAKSMIAIAKRP